MERQLPPAPPSSPAVSSDAEAVSVINHSTEQRDEQTYNDICNSRIDLLENHYYLLKDTLRKAMGIADIWWGADDVNDLEKQAKLGTQLIDDIIQQYLDITQVLVNVHQNRFGVDKNLHSYLDLCATSIQNCFTPASGMNRQEVKVTKGLTVRFAEVDQIRKILSDLRKNYGRKILLEKGVRDHGYDQILKAPQEDPQAISWSLLWAGLTKPEDVKLWSIVPREDLPMHKRSAFEEIQRARTLVLGEKIDEAQDFWESKLEKVDDDDATLEEDADDEWAELFENMFANRFRKIVEKTKLRLMKECNIFNFRFLGTLPDQVRFEEDLHLRALGDLERKDWRAFVQYRMQLLRAERACAESLQFVPMDDTDE